MDLQVKTCEPPSLGKPHPLHLINIILLAGIAKASLARLCKGDSYVNILAFNSPPVMTVDYP